MRILVTGAGGQLGSEVVDAFPAHEVVGLDRTKLDVADRDSVLGAVTTLRPDRIVHTAAWTDVDGCESDRDRAFRVNVLGTRHVVDAARRVGAHVVHISSDYVFSGENDRPYTEWDAPGPRSVYGHAKLAAEGEADPAHAVVRTSWVIGRRGRNFARTILRLLGERDEVHVVDDQVGCPTVAEDLASAIARLSIDARPGLFHVTNQGAVTWYELACAVAHAAGADAARLRPIATAELDPPRPAHRPRWSVLDNAALRLSGLPLLPEFQASLPRLVKALA